MDISALLATSPVMPVIVLDKVADAVPLARALVAGGIRVLEVTLRTAAALDSIRAIRAEVPDAIVGAGTVVTPADLDAAAQAGATFAVSPGASAELLRAGRESAIPLLPGVMTPSDVINALAAGYTAMKLFPAAQAGGIGMLKALAGPFPQARFCPTGGIDAASAPSFLALPNVACVGGSWLTPAERVRAGDWAAITGLARTAAALRPAGKA
ncbi:keto-deoxy-phosphogluconate aldolase [Azoarcus sp. DD4]|uniref:bifunctional 4-hydroxy-2-oxoglutarate aldolase/2-dehydro-3-deoxy-phosphogluconate aldolase n=1 Tax=Azoarcus sp. DD4 TaxID=2027405 RepID=UPI001127BECC|nr:bifunctional 4-hydroxy-2-oxoglutarate aldolase/2-dehydro-3-deoxy-phosphogluconate aldolase [Azoarcus sp. DD4]QDF97197.1 keto-deoxy-phosphogluconate aldolase [Azoarcus sp. DD4]